MFLVSKRKEEKRGGVSEGNGKRRELTRGRKRLNFDNSCHHPKGEKELRNRP